MSLLVGIWRRRLKKKANEANEARTKAEARAEGIKAWTRTRMEKKADEDFELWLKTLETEAEAWRRNVHTSITLNLLLTRSSSLLASDMVVGKD